MHEIREERPSQIGPYRIDEPLGKGGMGIVYRGQHSETGQLAAVKTVRVPNPSDLFSIRREIHALTRLKHPSIVTFLGEGLDQGKPWYAMELLEGRTLADFRQEVLASTVEFASTVKISGTVPSALPAESAGEEPLPEAPLARGPLTKHFPEIVSLIRRLCAPLSFIHGKGLVHRDLKPANVFLRSNTAPILMDFGLVSHFAGSLGREVLQHSGETAGTPAYMAPEQIHGEAVDARADLYALGCLFYELVTGRRPFKGDTITKIRRQQILKSPTPPCALVDGLPEEVSELMLRLLAMDPRDRLGHVEDVANALAPFDVEGSPPVQITTRPYLYRPRLTGRSEIKKRLLQQLEDATHEVGSLALIGGESGVGKTFLATAIAQVAQRHGIQVVLGECLPVAEQDDADVRAGPLHPFRPLLQAVADRCLAEGPQTTARLLGASVHILSPHEPMLEQLPGVGEYAEPAKLPPEEARDRLLAALKAVLAQLAESQPVLLLLDDLQWADELTLHFLCSLEESFWQTRSIMLLGTYRSDEITPEIRKLSTTAGSNDYRLKRFEIESMKAMVADMLAMADPPPTLVQYLQRHSEGNPFFVSEYLRTALVEGLLTRESGSWQIRRQDAEEVGRAESIPLPSSLKELISRRIDGLSDNARKLAQQASVIGREFEATVLLAASAMSEQDGFEAMTALFDRQVLEQRPGGRLRFRHDKIRELTYARIHSSRRELHRCAAQAIEDRYIGKPGETIYYPELVHHWRTAGEAEKLLHYLGRAGEQAIHAAASDEARQYLHEARELHRSLGRPGGNLRPARWERQLGEVHFAVDERVCRGHMKRALGLLGFPVPTGRFSVARSVVTEASKQIVYRMTGKRMPFSGKKIPPDILAEGIYAYDFLLRASRTSGDSLLILYLTLGSLNLADQDAPEHTQAIAYGLAQVMAGAASLTSVAERYGALARRALESTDDVDARTFVHASSSVYHSCRGQWDAAVEQAQEAVRISKEFGLRGRWAESILALRNGHHCAGRFSEAEAVDTTLCESDVEGISRFRMWSHANRAVIRAIYGRLDEAAEDIQAAQALSLAGQETVDSIILHTTSALVALAQEQYQDSRVELETAAPLFDKLPSMMFEVASSVIAANNVCVALVAREVYDSPQDRAQMLYTVQRLSRHGRTYARSFPPLKPDVLTTDGDIAWLLGRRARAVRCWEKALVVAGRFNMPYQEARVRLALAEAHADSSEQYSQQVAAKQVLERLGLRADDVLRLSGRGYPSVQS